MNFIIIFLNPCVFGWEPPASLTAQRVHVPAQGITNCASGCVASPRGTALLLDEKKLKLGGFLSFHWWFLYCVSVSAAVQVWSPCMAVLSLSSSHTQLLSPSAVCQAEDPCALGLFTFIITVINWVPSNLSCKYLVQTIPHAKIKI